MKECLQNIEIKMIISNEKTGIIAKRCIECGCVFGVDNSFCEGVACPVCGGYASPIGWVKPYNYHPIPKADCRQ